jgi:uncharacterized protein
MDLSSRLRAIVRGGSSSRDPGSRELTYEPDAGVYHAAVDVDRMGEILGGRPCRTRHGACLVIDRRYESDRWHGDTRIGECELSQCDGLQVLDPSLTALRAQDVQDVEADAPRTLFIDLETTGLSGGAGTVAFLVGCGYFDLGAFQVRQFLLTSFAAERALLAAVSEFFHGARLIVSYNGKTFDVPVMETRWAFHRMEMTLDDVLHFDMLHPARRLWRPRATRVDAMDEGGCRLSTLERTLLDFRRNGDVSAFEIPTRFFKFLRSGDPRPLEPVLEHNRLDLVSLAAVTARAVRLTREGAPACRDGAEALALGRVYDRAGALDRAKSCYVRASASTGVDVRAEALYRLGIQFRRERRFTDAAAIWRDLFHLAGTRAAHASPAMETLRQFAAEALAIHHEHRERNFTTARELAQFALDELTDIESQRADDMRHRLARLDRKIARRGATLFADEQFF